jgi:hypothetical protein
MPASWTFQITDAQGNALAELATASGRSVAFKRNQPAEASFTLSHEDDAAALLLGNLQNPAGGLPRLRCYRRAEGATTSTLVFRGAFANMQEDAEESALLTPVFRSPFGTLIGDGSSTGRFLVSSVFYGAQDAGQIAKALIDIANADSPTGLSTAGSITATKSRDRTYPVGANIGTSIQALTSVLDGFDFREDFVDGTGTTDATFNVVAALGQDQPLALFGYGAGTMANVRSVSRATLPPQNCAFVTGGNGLTATYQDAASVSAYERFWVKADFSDVVEQATLDDKARALVRPNLVKTVTFTPDVALSNCPRPFDNYTLGDTVHFRAARSALSEDTSLRVNAFNVVIDDNGFEAAEIADPSSPDDDRVLRASLSAEVTDG